VLASVTSCSWNKKTPGASPEVDIDHLSAVAIGGDLGHHASHGTGRGNGYAVRIL